MIILILPFMESHREDDEFMSELFEHFLIRTREPRNLKSMIGFYHQICPHDPLAPKGEIYLRTQQVIDCLYP